MTRLVRGLVLVCSLPLALPAGWCCMVSGPAAHAGTVPAAAGCPRCQPSAPAERPSVPAKKNACPCYDRQTTLPAASPVDMPDAGLVALLPPVVVAPTDLARSVQTSARTHDPPARARHVLYSVWLC